jgi:hydroxymethylglutaryl-CoA reductase (NADPH)
LNLFICSEATPFLVVTIGFERPYKLTQRIFEENSNSISGSDGRTRSSVHYVISRAVEFIAPTLIRDGLLEIVVFILGAKSTLPGLREFCLMSAFVIAFDIILMFTWYIAVLSLKLEVRRAKDGEGTLI